MWSLQITRKIIRKCVSADGVESEEVSSGGDAQVSVTAQEGDGHSKVVKRTVLKSEGGHTEVRLIFVVYSKWHVCVSVVSYLKFKKQK